jgi:ankyrin repeat protein
MMCIQIIKIDIQHTSMETERISPDMMESILYNCIIDKAPCKLGNLSEIIDYNGRSLLHLTALLNLKEETEYLLQNNVSPNVVDDELQTPLHLTDSYEIAELLLRYGADPNVRDRHGRTPLHYAVLKDNYEVAELLIRYSDPNVKDNDGNTPLHFVKSKKMLELLLRNGADPNITNSRGLPPIYYVDDCEVALTLFETTNKDILSAKNERGETLLHIAARHGCKELVMRLVDIVEDINAQNAEGKTALDIAVIYNNIGVVKILIERGALLKSETLRWILLALREGRPYSGVIELIIDRVRLDEILRYAFNVEQLRLLKLLLRRGIDLENLQI